MEFGNEKLANTAGATSPIPPLPQGWMAMQDPSGSGKLLYYNASTGQTSYARPIVRVLPPGWIRSQTPDGKTIFIHLETQRCSLEWPQEAPKAQTQQVQMPPLGRYTSTPGNITAPGRPELFRSQTVPVRTPQSPPTVTLNINAAAARKAVPGLEEAYAVHQLSERNTTQALSQKFNSDLAQTTSAMKEATISGAAMATRSAKVVGQTLVSRKKMAKASKKILVHTGAFGVKTGRAVKGVMGEMVDAADKKGKYQPKVRPFVPYDGQAQPQVEQQVHAYEYQQQQQMGMPHPLPTQPISSPSSAAAPVPTKVPSRKPVRPLSVSINPSISNQTSINLQASLQPSITAQPATSAGPPAVAPAVGQLGQLMNSAGGTTVEAGGVSSQLPAVGSAVTTDQIPQPLATTQLNQDSIAQLAGNGTIQAQQSPSQISSVANSPPGSTIVQQAQPLKPSAAITQQQTSPLLSIQAQGTLTIEASGSPPSYAQATGLPLAAPATARPPRRPLPQAANAPPQRPIAAQRPSTRPQIGPQYSTIVGGDPAAAQYIAYPQEQVVQYQTPQVFYTGQPPYTSAQPVTAGAQPVVIEQNQTIIQQSAGGQDLMLAQMQMQMAQQSAMDQLLLQQNADTQNMMLAQAQGAPAQQPVIVDQNIYVDQTQNVDVTNIQETNVTAYADYGSTDEVVTFADTGYEEVYATETAEGELVYVDEADTAGEYYEVEYEVDATGETYEADFGVDDAGLEAGF